MSAGGYLRHAHAEASLRAIRDGKSLHNVRRKIERLDYEPLPSQFRFHASSARFKGFSGPVGSGKTKAGAAEALCLAFENPGCPGMICAPTYPLLEAVAIPEFLEFCRDQGVRYKHNESKHRIYLPDPDVIIEYRTTEKPERLRGKNIAWFWVDELTYALWEAWLRLMARARHPQANRICGYGTWTPKGFDEVWEHFISTERIEGYDVVLASPSENKFILENTPDFYDQLQTSYSDKFYRQEALGEYIPQFSGMCYYAFSDDNVRDLGYVRGAPLVLCCDFNITPMCWLIGQRVKTETGIERIHILREVELEDASIDEAAQFAIDRMREIVPDWEGNVELQVYGDASGNNRVRSAAAGAAKSDWEAVKRNLRLEGWLKASYHIPSANPAVKDRVESVNRCLRDATAQGVSIRLLVDRSCKKLKRDFNRVHWKEDSHGNKSSVIDKSDMALTHLSDAVGYLTHRLYGVGRGFVGSMERSAW